VVLVGATGLVGAECLKLLLADPAFERVVVLARRPLEGVSASPKLAAHVVDFDHLEAQAGLFTADQLVCCLGTTIGQAGSKERFRAVDFGIPLALAKLGVERGVRHFLLVSALGANARSRVFYNKVKGELEEALFALPFRSLSIVRPSLLLGARREFRLGETLARRFALLMPGKYAAIHARDVAAALVRLAKEDAPGRRVVESAEMREWARRRTG
jgi:uncharacterized protein YbjT (DUF2867 family)